MNDTVSTPARRNTVFAVIAMALLMMSIDSTIVATALHAIQQGLDTSINLAGWTITAYSFGFVLMLPVSGKLAQTLLVDVLEEIFSILDYTNQTLSK